jgi:hypothetical protein
VNDKFVIADFCEHLYDVRYELARARYLDSNLDKIQEHLIEISRKYDIKKNGKISLTDLKSCLLSSKKVNLTPFQIQTILGLSEPDASGCVNYKNFSYKAKFLLEEYFSLKSLIDKSTIIRDGKVKYEDTEDVSLSKLDLFKVSLLIVTCI